MTVREVDVLVIGAGQAGLATARRLADTGLSFLVLERHPRIGDSWRRRYDSLVLFSPRSYSAPSGLDLPGDPAGYPDKDEIADYLERYARSFDLPVVTGESVVKLEKDEEGFRAETESGRIVGARAVIVATGAFQTPVVPGHARKLGPDVVQLTAGTYRRPAQLPPGPVAVVGDGGTGRQLAREIARTHDVWLSTGRARPVVPQRTFGRDTMEWFAR